MTVDSLVLQAVARTDRAGPRSLQVKQRVTGAGLDGLVLTELQTEDPPEGGAGSRHQDPVARHTAAVTTHEDQVSMERILGSAGNLLS